MNQLIILLAILAMLPLAYLFCELMFWILSRPTKDDAERIQAVPAALRKCIEDDQIDRRLKGLK